MKFFRYRNNRFIFRDGHKIVEIACIETKDLIPTGKVFHKLINPKEVCLKKHLKFMVFQKNF
jgi:DNA polymerase III epsilon subunit-like protein